MRNKGTGLNTNIKLFSSYRLCQGEGIYNISNKQNIFILHNINYKTSDTNQLSGG